MHDPHRIAMQLSLLTWKKSIFGFVKPEYKMLNAGARQQHLRTNAEPGPQVGYERPFESFLRGGTPHQINQDAHLDKAE